MRYNKLVDGVGAHGYLVGKMRISGQDGSERVQAVGWWAFGGGMPLSGGVAGTEGRLGWARQRRTTKKLLRIE